MACASRMPVIEIVGSSAGSKGLAEGDAYTLPDGGTVSLTASTILTIKDQLATRRRGLAYGLGWKARHHNRRLHCRKESMPTGGQLIY